MSNPTLKPDQILFTFKKDTGNTVSRSTVKKLAALLGLDYESQVIHLALRKYADEMLASYEPDDRDLTEEEFVKIKASYPQGKSKSIKSSLI